MKTLAVGKGIRTETGMLLACVLAMCVTGCEAVNALSQGVPVSVSTDWSTPEALQSPVNSPEWEDSPSITPDGRTLLFTRGRDRDVETYLTRKTETGWSEPEPLDKINLKSFPTGGAHTQDGKTLFLASFRPGGLGQADIYKCQKVDGVWTNLENIGAPVNTEHMESEPYISPDGKTLYFASNRTGNTDIWFCRRAGDSWTEPENMGPPINTNKDETQPFLTRDGKQLYFMAVNRDGIGGPAIFRSVKKDDRWQTPDLVVSGMVGEPTLTADERYLYFVHIIQNGSQLIDAEIMVARRK